MKGDDGLGSRAVGPVSEDGFLLGIVHCLKGGGGVPAPDCVALALHIGKRLLFNYIAPMDNGTPKAGRPREFDPKEKAAQAIDVFRQYGFRGATTRRLESCLGVNQASLYRVFDSKIGLLNAALDCYEGFTEEVLLGPLAQGDRGLQDIDRYLEVLSSKLGNGCLLVALMGETDEDLDAISKRTTQYRKTLHAAMKKVLVRAAKAGELAESQIAIRADVLIALVLGINVAARDGSNNKEAKRMISSVRAEIKTWG